MQLADELACDCTLLDCRHQMRAAALLGLDRSPLADAVTEGDALFQNAGEKGDPHRDPADPPRRRAKPTARAGADGERPSAPRRRPKPGKASLLTAMNHRLTTKWKPGDGRMEPSAIPGASMRATMMAIAYAKCIATRWRGFGPVCVIFSGPFGVSTRIIWRSM